MSSAAKPDFSRAARTRPRRRAVAPLRIAQRQISIRFSHRFRKQNHAKPLPENIKTVADWIQVKRPSERLTACHLAARMSIAATLVLSREDDAKQRDNRQLEVLANLLGCDADSDQ
jgi:hypothetical protein